MSILGKLSRIRAENPGLYAKAIRERRPGRTLEQLAGQKLLIIAADHPARGMLGAGKYADAMSNREIMLERCLQALQNPRVDGFLGTADLIEDLTVLGALEGKLVYGSVNRAGLAGSVFEVDDRFTAYANPDHLPGDGGKILLRICLEDGATPAILEKCAQTINLYASRGKTMIVEPFMAQWREGKLENDLSAPALAKAAAVVSGLGETSRHTWLKVPYVPDMERALASTTLPALILGGQVPADRQRYLQQWEHALSLPTVKGLVIGRSLLYPRSGDVTLAVQEVVELL